MNMSEFLNAWGWMELELLDYELERAWLISGKNAMGVMSIKLFDHKSQVGVFFSVELSDMIERFTELHIAEILTSLNEVLGWGEAPDMALYNWFWEEKPHFEIRLNSRLTAKVKVANVHWH